MNAWLVTIGEPVPLGMASADRPHRTGTFAALLARRGHQVTWWTSNFDHFRKRTVGRAGETPIAPGFEAFLLEGGGYRSNVGLARLRDHRRIAVGFRNAAVRRPDPDIVVAALPSVDLALEAVRYGQSRGVPVVLDMRDMWPDIFVEVLPRFLRGIGRLGMAPLFRLSREACAGATAITGITDAFVDWGVARGDRPRTPLDRSFPMGYVSSSPPADRLQEAEAFWRAKGLAAESGRFVACFIGSIGRQFDFDSILGAARILAAGSVPVSFVLCGTGDRQKEVAARAKELPNVLLPGWIDGAQVHVLLRRSSVGLDPLPNRFDYLATINNKCIEYLSAGLPVVSCPDTGTIAELLRVERCGLSYPTSKADALAGILRRLAEDPGERQRLAENAVRVYQQRFVAETVYAQMADYLQDVVSAFRGTSPRRDS